MAQFTSTQTTTGGAIINAVLDTVTNIITYTVTTPTGATATSTLPATENGNKSTNAISLSNQIQAQGSAASLAGGFASALARSSEDVNNQAAVAQREATAQNQPVAEPAPIPVAAADNPNPAPNAAFDDANASPQSVIDPNSDPNTNIGNDSQEQLPQPQQTISIASDPNTNIGEEGQTVTSPNSITENVFDPRQEVTESVFDPRQEVTESVFDPTAGGSGQGISTTLNDTRSKATKQDTANFQQKPDWRARLSLAPNSNYLYNVPKGQATVQEE